MNQVLYLRLVLLKFFSSSREQYKICYAMESRNTKYFLWGINIKLRDNVSIIASAVIGVLSYIPIQNMMTGNPQFTIVVMNNPRRGFDPVPIIFEVKVNNCLELFCRGAQLSVERTSPE